MTSSVSALIGTIQQELPDINPPLTRKRAGQTWAETHREVMRQSNRAYYARNREAVKAKMNAKTPDRLERARALKAAAVEAFGGCCQDCGFYGPMECYQFDHVRGKKIRALGHMFVAASIPTLLAELLKCELVCGNCHVIRTMTRRRMAKAKAAMKVSQARGETPPENVLVSPRQAELGCISNIPNGGQR